MSLYSRLYSWFFYYYTLACTLLSLAWLRINAQLGRGEGNRSSRSSVLIIGDGFAEGFGDWIVCGRRAGMSRFLEKMLNADADVKSNWTVESRGHFGSCSEEWLPSCSRKPACLAWGGKETLWKDLLNSSAFARSPRHHPRCRVHG